MLVVGVALTAGAANAGAQDLPAEPGSSSVMTQPFAHAMERPPDPTLLRERAAAASETRREREAWLASDGARRARADSHTRYRGLSAQGSEDLLRSQFGDLLDGLTPSAVKLAAQGRFEDFFDDYTARVRTPDGPRIVKSWVPLRTAGADGEKHPVDLTLQPQDGGFAPANPLVAVSLPSRLDAPVRVGPDRIPIWLDGAAGDIAVDSLDSRTLVASGAYPDADVVLAPVQEGVEVMWQIRSPESPESYRLQVGLPPGAVLEKQDGGAVAVTRGGETLTQILPPRAVDAQGEERPVDVAVAGERITYTVSHRSADVAYPIALDPVVEDQRGWWSGYPTGEQDWVPQETKTAQYYTVSACWQFMFVTCYGIGGYPWGLQVQATPTWYYDGDFGQFYYVRPGTTSYISQAEFSYMLYDWRRQCCMGFWGYDGLWNGYAGNWASVNNVNYDHGFWSDTRPYSGTGVTSVSFGQVYYGAPQYIPEYIIHYLGGALIYLDDPESPTVSITSAQPVDSGNGGWMSKGSFEIAATSSDPGLGVRKLGLDSPSSLPYQSTHRDLSCPGTKDVFCPPTAADTYQIPAATLPEGSNTLSVFAEDALGKRTIQQVKAKVDRASPGVALSGPLYDHRDRPLDEAATYALHIQSAEPSCASDGDRSGVANIQVLVDGVLKASYPQSTIGDCVYDVDWTYRTADSPGAEHAITVIATDQAGNSRVHYLRPIHIGPPTAPDAGEPAQGLAATAGLGEENIEHIDSPKPNLLPMWYGDIDPAKGYFGSGFSSPRVAVGGGRVYVATGSGGVKSFDADNPADATTAKVVTTNAAPGGIAYYNDELYVVGDRRIDVYDTNNKLVRSIGIGACHDGTLGALESTANAAGCDNTGIGLKRPQGIDVAWGKLFVADEAGSANTRVVRAYGAANGIPLGLTPLGDPGPDFRDLSVAPDQNMYFDGRRASAWFAGAGIPWLNSGLLLDGYEAGALPATGTASADWCACPNLRGTDWVWGMNWLLATTNNGSTIEEFGPSVRKRIWAPKQASNGTVSDIAYRKREERLDAAGKLLKSDWINGAQQVVYIASDADIYAVGSQGEHWLEQARNFDHLELTVDGTKYAFAVNSDPPAQTSTRPAGTLTLDTDQVPSGVHDLKLIAYFTNRGPLTVENADLHIDHTPPTGRLDYPGKFVKGTVTLTGDLADAHRGPKDWAPQLAPTGTNSWTDICRVQASGTHSCSTSTEDCASTPGSYSCTWDTTRHADGKYDIHAALDDLMTDRHDNPTTVSAATTTIDNTAPTLNDTGPLHDAIDFRPLNETDDTTLHVAASDATSGVVKVNVAVDGVSVSTPTQSCPSGGCSLNTDYVLPLSSYSDGAHTVTVTATDQVGLTSTDQWQIDIESIGVTPPPGPAGESPAASPSSAAGAAPVNPAEFSPALQARLGADGLPLPTYLLPCTSEQDPPNFPVWSLGSSFQGLAQTDVVRTCFAPSPLEPIRANLVSYVYGSCTPTTDSDGAVVPCSPPLEIQSWPACERSLWSYGVGPVDFQIPYVRVDLRGAPGASFEDGARLEIYTGDSTIVIYGADPAQVQAAVDAVRQESAGTPLGLTAPGGVGGLLPPPAHGALEGTMPCL